MRMRVDDLHFSYGAHQVLKGVSFHVEDSGFVSLLGPNGAEGDHQKPGGSCPGQAFFKIKQR